MTDPKIELVKAALEKHFSHKAVFCVSVSLTDSKAKESYLLMAGNALYIASILRDGEIEFTEYLLGSIKKPSLELAGACVILRVESDGEPFDLCRATLSEKNDLSEAARWIRSVCDEGLEVSKVEFKPISHLCPVCSAPLQNENSVCPNCAGAVSSAKRV